MFTTKRPHYSLALFSNFISTCTTLIYIQKDPRLLYKFPKYAKVAKMVRTTSVASLFHHEGRRNKSLCNTLFAFMFPFCNTSSHSRYFHWYGDPSILPESNRGSVWMQISFLQTLCTCIWNLKTMPVNNKGCSLVNTKSEGEICDIWRPI